MSDRHSSHCARKLQLYAVRVLQLYVYAILPGLIAALGAYWANCCAWSLYWANCCVWSLCWANCCAWSLCWANCCVWSLYWANCCVWSLCWAKTAALGACTGLITAFGAYAGLQLLHSEPAHHSPAARTRCSKSASSNPQPQKRFENPFTREYRLAGTQNIPPSTPSE
jgi:hypothetical protein